MMSRWSAAPEYETSISESALKVEINAKRIEYRGVSRLYFI